MSEGAVETISVVVPVLNEAAGLAAALGPLQAGRGPGCEVIVVDGGSEDGTPDLARGLADRVLHAPRGRARQMNAGAAVAVGRVLLFLHADTRLPAGALERVRSGLARAGRRWGRFDVRLAGRHPLLRVVERAMSLRSRLTGIATGDQALFVTRATFDAVGGFPDIPLMEDIAISRHLKRLGRPLCLRERVLVSSRRWERDGVLRTVALMWRLRAAYALGAAPADLVARYYPRGAG